MVNKVTRVVRVEGLDLEQPQAKALCPHNIPHPRAQAKNHGPRKPPEKDCFRATVIASTSTLRPQGHKEEQGNQTTLSTPVGNTGTKGHAQ